MFPIRCGLLVVFFREALHIELKLEYRIQSPTVANDYALSVGIGLTPNQASQANIADTTMEWKHVWVAFTIDGFIHKTGDFAVGKIDSIQASSSDVWILWPYIDTFVVD